jgi:purine-binding chemotaxis protein CheW
MMEPALPDSEPANAPPPPAAGGTLHFLLLALAGQRCALPRAAVRELLPLPLLSRPPGLPPVLAGFANLGGEPLPVLHAARLLGLAALAPEQGQDALYRHIVVLELGGTRAGLLVDRVLDLLAAPAGSLRPVPPDRTLNGCVAAGLPDPGGTEAGGLLPVLDPARLLLAEERAVLQGLTEAARARASEWTAG